MRGKRLALTLVLTVAGTFCGTEAARGAISCTISAVGVSFGTYNVFSATPLDSTGSVTYNCSGIGQNQITINLSRGGAPTFSPRRMLKSSEALNYNLYLDAARTTIWGDATSGTSQYGPIRPSGGNDTLTIYGRIPAGQDASAGSYTDTVIATINF
jgi:spore coat protein U-like protein